jgi:predicted nucleic acid-binding protein
MLPVCRFDHRGHVGLLIYLDICCFNRPFDQQSQTLVRLQTEAKLAVQRGVRDGQLRLAWSAVLDLENAGNPDAERVEAITLWRDLARVDVPTTPAVEAIAEAIVERGVKAMDALHVASAITAGATWLLTTDLRLIRKMHGDDRIVVADPIDFIRYWQGDDDENRV